MREKKIQILNKMGLHARPAAMLVSTASKFKSDIFAIKDGTEVNCKSIMGVMMLAAETGSWIILRAEGPDEIEAIDSLSKLFQEKFGEQ
ncbi:MAG: HPr family phosphocarrier protein [candidate division Zixibacteria bacterium]|nr:HPr family phosphocarrier protein [candidate division Zixibacteria bacterium]